MSAEQLRTFVPDEDPGQPSTGPPPVETVASVIRAYLVDVKHDNDPKTFAEKEHVLGCFEAAHGPKAVSVCKPLMLTQFVKSRESLVSDWTISRWIKTVKAAFNWAVRNTVIPANPFAICSHRSGGRGRPATDAEYRALLRHSTDALFRRLVLFIHYTGARPGEICGAEWSDVRLETGELVLAKHKTVKKTGQPRTIVLHPKLVKLLIWLRRNDPHPTAILCNKWRNRWSNSCISQRLTTLRKRAGLADDVRLGYLRHSFATGAILAGVDLATLAVLLGHKGTRQTSWYVSLARQTDHLRAAVVKATGGGNPLAGQ